VRVTDAGWTAASGAGGTRLYSEGSVSVRLIDVNEPPVFTEANFSRSVPENAAVGVAVGLVLGWSDPDAGQNHTFVIMSGNANGAFRFSSGVSGQLLVSNPAALDFETAKAFSLAVTVTDGGAPSALSATSTVVVTLIDVYEPCPTGFYSTLGAGAQCEPQACPAGAGVTSVVKGAVLGATNRTDGCTTCQPGNYSQGGTARCAPAACAAGSSSASAGAASPTAGCAACPAGRWALGSATQCAPLACNPGAGWVAVSGGSKQPNDGCAACTAGFFSPGGAATCSEMGCAPGSGTSKVSGSPPEASP
jgi:hypothetical protein